MWTKRFRGRAWGLYILFATLWVPLMATAKGAPSDKSTISRNVIQTALQSTQHWPLPSPGPPGLPDKSIVYIGDDLRNAGILGVGAGIREAVESIGWQVHVFDIGANDAQRDMIVSQVLRLRPDGIILGSLVDEGIARSLKRLEITGVPIIGWHVAPSPGPVENSPIRLNVATDSLEVAKMAAHYVIAESAGRAGVVIFTDSRYAIAVKKAQIMGDILKDCTGCRLLEIVDIPLDKAAVMMPDVTQRLLRDYGDNWQYSLAINDLYFDHAIATLVINGCKPEGPPVNISAGDGSPSALLRIRYGSYQQATVPEPLLFHGWQLVDELNRIMQGAPPSGYQTPPSLLTEEIIRDQNDKMNFFDPKNNYRKIYREIWTRD